MGANAEDGFATLDDAADAIAAYQPHRPRPKDLSGLAKNLRLGDDGRWRWHWDPGFLDIRTGGTSEHARNAHHDALSDMARGLTLPTLLIRGRLSDLVTEERWPSSCALVPHAQYVDVADAGHMIAGDRNDVFTDAVTAFLDRPPDPADRERPDRPACDDWRMTTSQDLHDRIAGQNVPKRFLANVARNGATTVLQWKNSTGAWDSWTLDDARRRDRPADAAP